MTVSPRNRSSIVFRQIELLNSREANTPQSKYDPKFSTLRAHALPSGWGHLIDRHQVKYIIYNYLENSNNGIWDSFRKMALLQKSYSTLFQTGFHKFYTKFSK